MSASVTSYSSSLDSLEDGTPLPTGTIKESSLVLQNFIWTLERFSTLRAVPCRHYYSRPFHLGSRRSKQCILSIYPAGNEPQTTGSEVGVCLVDCESGYSREKEDDVKMDISLTFRSIDGTPICRKTKSTYLHGKGSLSFENMIRWEDLLKKLPEDKLLIEVSFASPMEVNSDGVSAKLKSDLMSMWTSGKHSDAVAIADGCVIPVHKGLLAARSKVFASMIEQETKETDSSSVLGMDDLDSTTMLPLLEFVYTASVREMNTDVAVNLMKAAEKFKMEDLKAFCRSFLMLNLDSGNVVTVLVCADVHNDDELKMKAMEYFCRDDKLIDSKENEELLKKHPSLLIELLKIQRENNSHRKLFAL